MKYCIRCGYCCTTATCALGRLHGAKKRNCEFQKGKRPGQYYCELVKNNPNLKKQFEIGEGCSSPLCNTNRENVPEIIKYLHKLNFFYNNKVPKIQFYEYIIIHGDYFTDSQRNIKEEQKYIKALYPNQWKACYQNSLQLALAIKEIKYYEGWYITDVISVPFEHAFCVNDKNQVIDLTANGKFEVKEYFGLEIPEKYIWKKISKTKKYLNLLFEYVENQLS